MRKPRQSRVLRAAAKLWYVKTIDLLSSVPVPRDSHTVASGAADPDRVLLIGNGHTHGWGTLSHQLALTGQLQRSFSRRTGRGTDVTYVGDEMMSLDTVVPWLRGTRLNTFDLVLVVVSLNDALRLTPVEAYREQMDTLLGKLVKETKPSARIIVTGIEEVAVRPYYPGLLARLGQRAADRFSAVTRELVGRYDGIRFMEATAPEAEPGRPHGSPGMYAAWAEAFMAECAPALEEARLLDTDRTSTSQSETERWDSDAAERIITQAPREGWPGLNTIVADAKRRFGTDIVYVSVIDHEQQYFAASTSPNGRSVPLELTHCNVTFRSDELVTTRNALQDARFGGSPFIDVTQMRFYNGVPLQDETGQNIGTFCVASALPTGGRRVTEPLLLEYAARAQHELQRLGRARITDRDDAESKADSRTA